MHCGRVSYSVAFREDVDATDRDDDVITQPSPLPPRPTRVRAYQVPQPTSQPVDQLSGE